MATIDSLVEATIVGDDDLLLIDQGGEGKKYKASGIFGGRDGLRSLAGFTDELLAQAGIVDDGHPDELGESQRVDAMRKLFTNIGTVADIASGRFKVGATVYVKDRAGGVFNVVAGGTPNGYDILDAGGGNTAVLKYNSEIDAKWVGLSASNTNAENKTILDNAILTFGGLGSPFVIKISPDLNYGYDRNDVATHPNLSTSNVNVRVIDYSIGDTYTLPSRDGSQKRIFSFTPNETDSLHDGNTEWLRAAWPPAYFIMNDAALAAVGDPSRAASDNRRATTFYGNDGVANWGVGQGNRTGAGLTDAELSSFKIVVNGIDDIGVVGLTSVLSINKTNGYVGWNVTTPIAPFDYYTRAGQTSVARYDFTGSGGNGRHITVTQYGAAEYQVRENDISITYAGSTIFRIHKLGNARATKGVTGGAFTTANRPTGSDIEAGTMIFDTTLGKPIWKPSTGSANWVDATGAIV